MSSQVNSLTSVEKDFFQEKYPIKSTPFYEGFGFNSYFAKKRGTQDVYEIKCFSNLPLFEREREILTFITEQNKNTQEAKRPIKSCIKLPVDTDILFPYRVRHVYASGDVSLLSFRNYRFSFGQIIEISEKILHGLNHLASLNIVHANLTLKNITLNSQGEVKIANFSRSVILRGCLQTPLAGIRGYQAPEVIFDHDVVDNKRDLWALAQVLIWLRYKCLPFHSDPYCFDSDEVSYSFDQKYEELERQECFLGKTPHKIKKEDFYHPLKSKKDLFDSVVVFFRSCSLSIEKDRFTSIFTSIRSRHPYYVLYQEILQACLHQDPSSRYSAEQILNSILKTS